MLTGRILSPPELSDWPVLTTELLIFPSLPLNSDTSSNSAKLRHFHPPRDTSRGGTAYRWGSAPRLCQSLAPPSQAPPSPVNPTSAQPGPRYPS